MASNEGDLCTKNPADTSTREYDQESGPSEPKVLVLPGAFMTTSFEEDYDPDDPGRGDKNPPATSINTSSGGAPSIEERVKQGGSAIYTTRTAQQNIASNIGKYRKIPAARKEIQDEQGNENKNSYEDVANQPLRKSKENMKETVHIKSEDGFICWATLTNIRQEIPADGGRGYSRGRTDRRAEVCATKRPREHLTGDLVELTEGSRTVWDGPRTSLDRVLRKLIRSRRELRVVQNRSPPKDEPKLNPNPGLLRPWIGAMSSLNL
ncbi:hypothetical protein DL96DRAFT_1684765 [Flagelloscypha sp. PMI_526]|nr:hypothetical protein DL96DRAFT_1684765 [Flagelloscypha sp. PMI_526]